MNLAAVQMSDAAFNGYMIALAVSGVLLLLVAILGSKQSGGSRAISALVGLVFLGYAGYLFFIFDGGSVFLSLYVFIVPVLVLINAFKGRKAAKTEPVGAVPPPPPPVG